jgi:DNA-binding response OmpR family regulator
VNEVEHERIIVGPLEIHPDRYLVLVGGRSLPLSQRELTLLTALARRRGEVVSRAELYEVAWARPLAGADRSVDVYVHKLRRKLESAVSDVRFIHTHHTIGYRLDPQPVPIDRARDGPPESSRLDDPSIRVGSRATALG